ncbi:MAG: hypothetical protein U5L04_14360 [Trueperaceae bacterium]|nr:hypothetical protein [Trueperaceae bacterium]
MTSESQRDEIAAMLSRAGEAHHRYEQSELGGQRDEEWAQWYTDWLLEHGLSQTLAPSVSAEQIRDILAESSNTPASEADEVGWAEQTAQRMLDTSRSSD